MVSLLWLRADNEISEGFACEKLKFKKCKV